VWNALLFRARVCASCADPFYRCVAEALPRHSRIAPFVSLLPFQQHARLRKVRARPARCSQLTHDRAVLWRSASNFPCTRRWTLIRGRSTSTRTARPSVVCADACPRPSFHVRKLPVVNGEYRMLVRSPVCVCVCVCGAEVPTKPAALACQICSAVKSFVVAARDEKNRQEWVDSINESRSEVRARAGCSSTRHGSSGSLRTAHSRSPPSPSTCARSSQQSHRCPCGYRSRMFPTLARSFRRWPTCLRTADSPRPRSVPPPRLRRRPPPLGPPRHRRQPPPLQPLQRVPPRRR
jgi:hypothetical protein